MAKDLQRAYRLAKVLHLLEHGSRNELVAAGRAFDEATRSHDVAMTCFTGDAFIGGPFMDLLATRLPKLSAAVEHQAHKHAVAQYVWQGSQMRALAASRYLRLARERQAQRQERVELDDIVETVLRCGRQASGKRGA